MSARTSSRPPLWMAYLAFGALGMCLYLLPTPLKGNEALPAKIVLTIEAIALNVDIEGAIELE